MHFKLNRRWLASFVLFVLTIISGYSQTGYTDLFTSNILNPGWGQTSPTSFTFIEANQQLQVNSTVSGYNNFYLTLSTPINISNNPVFKIKVKSASNVTLRVDLGDASGNNTNANPSSVAIVGNNTFQTVSLNYSGKFSQNSPTSATVNNTQIKTITFFLNAGSSFNGTIYLDNLILGDSVAQVSGVPGQISVNNIGYEPKGTKYAVFQTTIPTATIGAFTLVNTVTGLAVYTANPASFTLQSVPGWQGRYFTRLDFSNFQTPGTYQIQLGPNTSYPFTIAQNIYFLRTAASVVGYFNAMRSTDSRDYTMGFFGGRTGTVNVYGGYTDAAGDPGKYFSHLSFANYFNPQHNPFVTWSLLKSFEQNGAIMTAAGIAIQNEIVWGTDYINRNLDPIGYFYIGVFDDWGGSTNRQICQWSGSTGVRSANYECAFREGGGMAIAALAKAAAMNITGGTFSPQQCLQAATTAYAHLKSPGAGYATKNLEYCDDHTENIIDNYTQLLAATELYKATKNVLYLTDAQAIAAKLISKQTAQGWLYTDSALTRPFYHGVDEGLPVTALSEYLAIDNSNATNVKSFFTKWLSWYASITKQVYNPYNYVRAYAAPYTTSQQAPRIAFFMPHNNETGYWWQGENARLGSMSAAFMNIARTLNSQYTIGTDSLSALAISQVDWILGNNPFNVCFMFGVGQTNYPNYPASQPRPNMNGGICNGITAMDSDENNIDWKPFADTDWNNWRWIEQWLPHNGWFLVNSSQMAYLNNNPPSTLPGVSSSFGFTANQLTISFTNSSTGANVYNWSLSSVPGIVGSFIAGNANAANPIFTYTTSGNYLVCLTVTNTLSGTSNSSCKSITVCQPPVLTVSPTGAITACGTSLLQVNTAPGWTYNWLINGSTIVGATNPAFTTSLSGLYTVSVNSFGCTTVSGTTALSIISAPGVLGGIAGKNTVCPGNSVLYTVPGLNLAGITYTWTTPSGWSIQSGQGTTSLLVTAGTVSGAVSVSPSNTCGVGSISFLTLTVNPSLNATVQVSNTAIAVCSGLGVTFTATGLNAGTAPAYNWQVNGNSLATGSTFNYNPSNGDIVRAILTAGGILPNCLSNTSATSTGVTLSVSGLQLSSVGITSSNYTVCSGTGVTLTAIGINAGTLPNYSWQVNGSLSGIGNTFSYIPSNGDVVRAVQTVGGVVLSCLSNTVSTSNPITLTVNGLQFPLATISSAITYVCSGTGITFTATGTNVGSAPAIGWKVNGVVLGNGNSFNYTPSNGDIVRAVITVGGTLPICLANSNVTSNGINLTVNAIPLAPLPATTTVNYCQGSPAIPLSATGTALLWYTSSTGGVGNSVAPIPSTTSVGTTNYFVSQTVSNCESQRAKIIVSVYAIPVSPIIISNPVNYCQGVPATPLSATGLNLLWYTTSIGGIGSISITPSTSAVGSVNYYVSQQVNGCQSPRASLIVMVNPITSPSLSINSNAISVCSGSGITFTATSTNAGTLPAYGWRVNGQSASTGNTFNYMPSNGDVVSAIVTVGGTLPTCLSNTTATSVAVTVSVSGLKFASVSVGSSASTVCAGTSVTFTASGVNTGTSPIYNWNVNGSTVATGNTYSYIPANGDQVYAILTTGGALPNCLSNPIVSSTGINLVVNPLLTPSVTSSASANPVCAGTGVTYTASPTNGGTSPTYTWRVNGTIQSSNTSTLNYIPSNGDVINVTLSTGGTSGLCLTTNTATATGITAAVIGTLSASIAIAANSSAVCQGQSVTFTSTAVGTGSSPSYSWVVNNATPIAGTSSFTYVPANGDQIKAILTKGGTGISCITGSPATSASVTMNVTATVASSVSIVASATTVCSNAGVAFTATGINSGNSPVTGWQVNGIPAGIGSTFSYVPTNGDLVTATLTASGISCLVANPVTSNGISINVTPIGQLACLLPSPSSITGPSIISPNQQSVTYSVVSVVGVSYVWTIPTGATIVSGQGTGTIVLDFGNSVSGVLSLTETNPQGSVTTSINITTSTPTEISILTTQTNITIFPNPFANETQITAKDSFEYTIYDLYGKILERGNGDNGKLLGSQLIPGTYVIVIELSASGDRRQLKLVKY